MFSFISYQSAGIISVCHQAQPELSSWTHPQWGKSRTHHHRLVCQKSVKDLAGIYEGPSEETALLSCPLPHFILEVAQEFLEHFLQQHPSISQAQIRQNQSKKISFDSYTYGEMDAKSIQNHK